MPTLRKADCGPFSGVPATAEPVSWVAAATAAAPATELSSSVTSPRRVPGSTTAGKSFAGISRRSRTSVAHAPARVSKHWVVVALVSSVVVLPQSQ